MPSIEYFANHCDTINNSGAGIRTPDTRIMIPAHNDMANPMIIMGLPLYGCEGRCSQPEPFATFEHRGVAESGRWMSYI